MRLKQSAFTFIEVTIVLAAVAILIMLAIPSLKLFDTYYLQNDLEILLTTCNYLQQKAINQQKKLYLTFNQENMSYTYVGINNKLKKNALHQSNTFKVLSGIYGPPSRPKNLLKESISFKDNRIIFLPDGTTMAGVVYISNAKRKIMGALTCSPSQVSSIRTYLYLDDTWKLLP